ncbi:MAG TPA: alpha-ketoglutarate-dependent dioxygenase AlkB [Noviherbaspirillum sp.]|uniref:alpha-ketoglutarate-dependent dioxygenase AlkB family protein n=1 Tax=Noviherbaspirillum sp. TaxID=1926288 RepID=UPI002D415937|nr:alpha-ketoglutarate-dependent dioxygenase AlkB [Noviherbaspirillum sp.]HYD94826.1 alpha-ketoglutarate-dependent dioxygenase AlkB [Noviherbaspirillum sp.]
MHAQDLFDDGGAARIALPDADLRCLRGFYRQPDTALFLQALLRETAWRQETITLWGKAHLQPRLSAWHGDAGRGYSYSGVVLTPQPWTPPLLRIKADIEQATGWHFNSVLLNLYRDERDSVGWHSDAEPELGSCPAIASLSLGETRSFRLRHKTRRDLKPVVAIDLDDGCLLLMAGPTQRCWQHSVPKESGTRGPRINLTFRTILA